MDGIISLSWGWYFLTIVLGLVVLLFSFSWHEYAHALIASVYGDPTARLAGRLTLNPAAHWDKLGTTLLAATWVLRSLGFPLPIFGWGKPVPINELNFENHRWDGIVVALSGPMSNLLMAFVLALVASAMRHPTTTIEQALLAVLHLGVYLNVFLMFFNLLPLPPLDGSHLLQLVLPEKWFITLSYNPLWWMIGIFLVVFFLVDYLAIASSSLTSWLLTI